MVRWMKHTLARLFGFPEPRHHAAPPPNQDATRIAARQAEIERRLAAIRAEYEIETRERHVRARND